MRIKRFTAPNMKEAMLKVKHDLGADAIMLSERSFTDENGKKMVEITAALEINNTSVMHTIAKSQKSKNSSLTASSGAVSNLKDVLTTHGVNEELIKKITNAAKALGETGFTSIDTLEMVIGKVLPFSSPAEALKKGHTHVFIGPMGAGKTATITKLAVNRKLAGMSVGLMSMDFQKVGGYDQLNTFAHAMEEEAYLIKTPTDFVNAMQELGKRDFLLIDTPGVNPFNNKEMAELQRRLDELELDNVIIHVVMPANMDPKIMPALPVALASFKPTSVIFTKLDETLHLGGLINTASGAELAVCYMSDGPKIPDDFIEMDSASLAAKLNSVPKFPWEK